MVDLVALVKVSISLFGIGLIKNVLSSVLVSQIQENDQGRIFRSSLFVSSVVYILCRFHEFRDNLSLFIYVAHTYCSATLVWLLLTTTVFRLEDEAIYGKHPFYSELSNASTLKGEKLFTMFCTVFAFLLWIMKKNRNTICPATIPATTLPIPCETENILRSDYWTHEKFLNAREIAFSPLKSRIKPFPTSTITCRTEFPPLLTNQLESKMEMREEVLSTRCSNHEDFETIRTIAFAKLNRRTSNS